jgi:AcrR family transcriptional regulator
MPRLLDPVSRTATVANAVNDLVALHGLGALTMRRIAAECRLSTAALSSQFGSREHMLRVALFATSEARLDHLGGRVIREGAAGLLPEVGGDGSDVVEARVWLGWLELARSTEGLEVAVTEHREQEMAMLARRYDYRLGRHELLGILALVDGLLIAISDPVKPISPAEAREILSSQALGSQALEVDLGGSGMNIEVRAAYAG